MENLNLEQLSIDTVKFFDPVFEDIQLKSLKLKKP